MRTVAFNLTTIPRSRKQDCFICAGKIPLHDKFFEDDLSIGFLDLYPPTKGYSLIATKKHYEDATEMSKETFLSLQSNLFRIAKAIKQAFQPQRICIEQSGGLVAHLHFHIIPMYNDVYKNYMDVLQKKTILKLTVDERRAMSEEIKKHLGKK